MEKLVAVVVGNDKAAYGECACQCAKSVAGRL
jgi:hypothetical protein